MKPSKDNAAKNIRMFALATSAAFELLAGPFIGYFTGILLTSKLGMPALTMPIAVFMGFALSLYAVLLTIHKINKINDINPHA